MQRVYLLLLGLLRQAFGKSNTFERPCCLLSKKLVADKLWVAVVTYPTGAKAQFWKPQNQQRRDGQKRESRRKKARCVFESS